jgi:acetoin utilization protein AcuB
MRLLEIINQDVPELSLGDNGVNALNLMEQYDVHHLPVVQDGVFIGLISEDEVLTMEQPTAPFYSCKHDFPLIALDSRRHLYDALRLMSDQRLTLLPVINERFHYLGSLRATDLINALARTQAVGANGGVIELQMNAKDYSLTRIAQIVEGNDAKILSATLTTRPESEMVQLTLKINKEDLNAIIQSFNRYDYVVAESYMEPQYTEELRDRYEEFMKYLNM